ncbi:MAG TPA: hypothetical protein VNJ01_18390, partial [Bacteriovoracaceae bacterium]|nr:hypothetical protein [Bacteriovoracaceae bacterium]
MAMFKDAKAAINDPKSSKHVESKEIFRFLKGAVLGEKKKSGQPENSSILSKKIRINANLDKSVKAVGNLSNNLSNIIQTTEAMAALFKTDLPPGMKKLMGKAQKVSAMVNLATTAIAAFSTGGFMGAMSVMGSMGSMFGGGGKGQDSAMLAEINQKLDAVLENQKKIMELQIETMNMIKELAVMVDQYHQREMLALAELRDSSLVVNEISKSLLNRDVRACERMVNYQLSSIWKNFDFSKEAFFSINHLGLIQSRFTSTITSLGDIRRILGSVEDDGFRSCQRGLAEAFGGNASEENPLRAIFDSTGEKNLMKFQREIYHPLLSGLKEFSQVTDFDSLPLHLPVKTFAGLRHKIDYLNSATLVKHSSNDIYDLENLISVKNLERYLSHLIILLPVIEVNGAAWSRTTSEIISEYLEMANTGSNQNTRSNYFLRNALKLTQSAIAQEALLAGEPILHMIHDKKIREVLSASNCASDGREDSLSLVCSVRKNKLLLKNLL